MKRSTLRIRTATALRAEALTHVRGGTPGTDMLRLDSLLAARANAIGLVANLLSAIDEAQASIVGNLK